MANIQTALEVLKPVDHVQMAFVETQEKQHETLQYMILVKRIRQISHKGQAQFEAMRLIVYKVLLQAKTFIEMLERIQGTNIYNEREL
jgi:hypothetical protein